MVMFQDDNKSADTESCLLGIHATKFETSGNSIICFIRYSLKPDNYLRIINLFYDLKFENIKNYKINTVLCM